MLQRNAKLVNYRGLDLQRCGLDALFGVVIPFDRSAQFVGAISDRMTSTNPVHAIALALLDDCEFVAALREILNGAPVATPAQITAPPSDYMTASEFAVHRKVGRTTVFSWIAEGLPSIKQGGSRRIKWREADAFLDAGSLSLAKHHAARNNKKKAA